MYTGHTYNLNNYFLNYSKIQDPKNVLVIEDYNVSLAKINYALSGICELNITNNEFISLVMIKENKYDLILFRHMT